MGAKTETEKRQCQEETETVSLSEENVGKKEIKEQTDQGVG